MERYIKTSFALGGAAASYLFGGWSHLLSILLTFVLLDYATGMAAAWKDGKLQSNIGMVGIARKITIFAFVAVAHLVDTALGGSHMFRDTAIFFYLVNELLSMIENAGKLGVSIPPVLQKAVEALREKSDSKGDTKDE